MFFWPRRREFCPLSGKVELFVRHCMLSKASLHKKRFSGFSREKCYENLLATIDRSQANITFLLDTALGSSQDHFLSRHRLDPVVEFQAGTEAKAFLFLLEYLDRQSFDPGTLIYIVEDDYLHRPHWTSVLKEAFSLPIDYATLYDHRDKYFFSMYQKLKSRLFTTQSCHWRTTPSTTNTFAVRFKTLKEDLNLHKKFSKNRTITADHQKFCLLGRKGRVLVSSIPGWSTHAEPEFASPCVEWAMS